MEIKKQMSESYTLGLILTLVGGFLDAYTYICRGGVFANAQTGNIVLMSIKLAELDIEGGLYYLIPILAFMCGIFFSEKIKKHCKKMAMIHWRQIIIGFEIIVLIGITFVPQRYNVAVNVLVSFVCSLQVQSFRKISGIAYASTMCTGNLRSGTEQLCTYIRGGERKHLQHAFKYYGVILVFSIGAAFGGIMVNDIGIESILFACAGLSIAFIMMFMK